MDSPNRITRRAVLRALATAFPCYVALTAQSWAQAPVALDWPDDRRVAEGILRILIRLPDGRPRPPSLRVSIRLQGGWTDMPGTSSPLVYERKLPTQQRYNVKVEAAEYLTLERMIDLTGTLEAAQIYLVPVGWPYYFSGGVAIPVKPRPRLAGVVLSKRVATPGELAHLIARADQSGYRRVTRDPESAARLSDVNGSVFYFEPKSGSEPVFSYDAGITDAHGLAAPIAVNRLRSVFAAYKARVGGVVQSGTRGTRIIDSQYLIRFPRQVQEREVRDLARSVGARLLRASDRSGGFWLIDFDDPQNLGRHMAVIGNLVNARRLASGEPNLLVQIQHQGRAPLRHFHDDDVPQAICAVDPGNDPYEKCQKYLARQSVQNAWCYLEEMSPGNRYGSSSIRVASIDTGLTLDGATRTSSHPDVNAQRVHYCYNLDEDGGAACSNVSPPPAGRDPHGMQTYGIISAKADNQLGITGIAPNASHIAVQLGWIMASLETYAQALLWIGGQRSTPPDGRFDEAHPPPSMPPADIINCSHTLEGWPVHDLVDSAIQQLTSSGRNGLGTVLVYAAGNDDMRLETTDTLATHPRTIGVGNTEVASDGLERRQARTPANINEAPYGSNFSPWLRLCANGESSLSLGANPVDAGPPCEGEVLGNGVRVHNGTSAATAMVSGAAALVLSINPDLHWKQVRSILCATADKIDCQNGDPNGAWRWIGPAAQGGPLPTPCDLPQGLDWFSEWYGFGRLNTYAAVKLAHFTPAVG